MASSPPFSSPFRIRTACGTAGERGERKAGGNTLHKKIICKKELDKKIIK
jgi:hypothetical protein